MRTRRHWGPTIALALPALFAAPNLSVNAADPSPNSSSSYQVVATKADGIIATGINARGEVIGFEWREEKDRPGVIYQAPFLAKEGRFTDLPLLKGYTATFPAAVSDDGLVVGRASKPAPPGVLVPLRNQAFLWDAESGIRGLGALEGDNASFACDVTSDGRRISGFSVGMDRMRACVWDRHGDLWKGTALPHAGRLGSNTVAMSDDGNSVAAVDDVVPCLWTRSPAGQWTREVIGEPASLIPRGVNNAGLVVGTRATPDGQSHAVIWTRDKGMHVIEKPEGYTRSEANAVNNEGVVVGMVDGPHGSKISPRGFAYRNGRLHLITEGGPDFAAATCINDRGQIAGVVEKEEDDQPRPPASKPQSPP